MELRPLHTPSFHASSHIVDKTVCTSSSWYDKENENRMLKSRPNVNMDKECTRHSNPSIFALRMQCYSPNQIKAHTTTFQHVHQSSRRGYQQQTALFQVSDLGTNVGTSVHHTRTHMGPVGKLENGWRRIKSELYFHCIHCTSPQTCILFWLHRRSGMPALLLEPVPEPVGTVYDDQHTSAKKIRKTKCATTK